MSFAGHKMHGPRGIGGLYLGCRCKVCPCLTGGKQEHGLRAGTEATYLICGLYYTLAYNLEQDRNAKNRKRILEMKIRTIKLLIHYFPNIIINALTSLSKYNTVSICIPGVDSRKFVDELSKLGICINVGSACSLGKRSKVLEAIGVSEENEKGAFRISLSEYNTLAECEYVCDMMKKIYNKLYAIHFEYTYIK